MRIGSRDVAFGFGPRSFGWAIVLAGVAWFLTATAATAHAAPQDGVDPTGSNFAIWGSPRFNRQIGPDDVVVQVLLAELPVSPCK